MTVSNELIDSLLADYKKPEDLIGENGLLKQLTKRRVRSADHVIPDDSVEQRSLLVNAVPPWRPMTQPR